MPKSDSTGGPTSEPTRATDPLPTAPERARAPAMAAAMLAAALVTIDISIMYTALPAIAQGLGVSAASSVWVVNAYQLAMVAAVLPMAALGEKIGHRRMHLAGVTVFTLASLVCALAWSLPTLVAARVLQGLGAAATVSVTTALVRFIYPPHQLGRGLGLYAFIVSVSFAIGPAVASTILTLANWHWLFLLALPLGLATLLLGRRHLPATARSPHAFDPIAALLSATLFALFTFGLGQAAHGADGSLVAALLAGALASGALLLRRQAGHPAPILAVDLLRLPVFALSAATAVLSFIAQALAFVSLPFLFHTVMGWSQMATGLLMTPWPVVLSILSVPAGRLSERWPAGLLGGGGLLMLGLGLGLLARLAPDASALDISWRMALCAAGFALFQSPNMNALMTSAPAARSGGASGIVATCRMLGQAIGVALAAACFRLSPDQGPTMALWTGCAAAVLASAASLLRLRVRGTPVSPAKAPHGRAG